MQLLQKIKKKLKLIYFSGSNYHCPFCGYSSKSLEVVGHDLPVLREKQVIGGGRRPAGCYKCHSRDRERLLYAFIIEELKLPPETRILHIAPEIKLSKILLNKNFNEYICGDLHTPGYHYPDYVKNINILNIPYEDNHFDIVICNHVLEHIPQDIEAMTELRRVLKPGGKAILQVPISKNNQSTHEDFTISDPKKREELFGQFDHVRIYGQDYFSRLESAGFLVNKVNISEKYKKLGVNPAEDIFFCEKKNT
ncbi:class I SAM-dependent methyltransferase [Chryseobacterium potabilaquae]|uniref:Ubiquinone biosynthesis O-methyltransferase n=1 Tax=Chryseobacterium potabilaquae TaxID=2675057 RepID=A0A6N4X558_9FLAO|nr:class I SAM-dependent methyltransferase [Chryseobacterium potabilaquae]CAA7194366.1 Ubiquinone biosynthesis O-methyltransferase [Chryseobacterium potabilaquae]